MNHYFFWKLKNTSLDEQTLKFENIRDQKIIWWLIEVLKARGRWFDSAGAELHSFIFGVCSSALDSLELFAFHDHLLWAFHEGLWFSCCSYMLGPLTANHEEVSSTVLRVVFARAKSVRGRKELSGFLYVVRLFQRWWSDVTFHIHTSPTRGRHMTLKEIKIVR